MSEGFTCPWCEGHELKVKVAGSQPPRHSEEVENTFTASLTAKTMAAVRVN